jgi:guanine nucleotide-binding protein alpha-1 subunit
VLDALRAAQAESLARLPPAVPYPYDDDDTASDDPLFFSDDFEVMKARLEPLRRVEEILIARVAPGDGFDHDGALGPGARGAGGMGGGEGARGGGVYNGGAYRAKTGKARTHELAVSSSVVALLKGRGSGGAGSVAGSGGGGGGGGGGSPPGLDEWDEPTEVICHCREEMMALWEDPTVREVLRRRKVRVEESPGL